MRASWRAPFQTAGGVTAPSYHVLDLSTNLGASGAQVFNRDGELVGMLTHVGIYDDAYDDGDVDDFAYAINLAVVAVPLRGPPRRSSPIPRDRY